MSAGWAEYPFLKGKSVSEGPVRVDAVEKVD
jgi:hypothetical protein